MRQAGTTLDRHPETWATIAWSRWSVGDVEGGRRWADRLLKHVATHPGSVPELQVVGVRLHRSRSGAEPVAEAVAAARSVVDGSRSTSSQDPFLSVVLVELGAAENWLGDLSRAEEHLAEAVLVGRSDELAPVTAEALSHLAVTQFMAGHDQACRDLATECLALCEHDATRSVATRARAEVARILVEVQSRPWPRQRPQDDPVELPGPTDDLAGQFWRRILAARLALLSGSVVDAQRRLEVPFESPKVPDHLRTALLVERSTHALVTTSRSTLRELVGQLDALGAQGETLWARARSPTSTATSGARLRTTARLPTLPAGRNHRPRRWPRCARPRCRTTSVSTRPAARTWSGPSGRRRPGATRHPSWAGARTAPAWGSCSAGPAARSRTAGPRT